MFKKIVLKRDHVYIGMVVDNKLDYSVDDLLPFLRSQAPGSYDSTMTNFEAEMAAAAVPETR